MLNINEIIKLDTEQCITKIDNLPNPVVLYGAGVLCDFYVRLFRNNGIEPIICDSNPLKIGTMIYDTTIRKFEDVWDTDKSIKIVITTPNYYDEIKEQLMLTIPESQIIQLECSEIYTSVFYNKDEYKKFLIENEQQLNNLYEHLEDEESRNVMKNVICGNFSRNNNYFIESYSEDQYFPKDIIQLTSEEVFVDAGAYNGDTLKKIIEVTNGEYEKIYSFEPTEKLFEELEVLKQQLVGENNKITAIKKGLFDSTKKIGFTLLSGVEGANHIMDGANDYIDVIKLDEAVSGRVTFIKMDIEGSELMALRGAEKIILENKPKLAICVYHKYDDILTITDYIRKLGLDYKYYMRHHSNCSCETVFYAV